MPVLILKFPRDYALSKNGMYRWEHQGAKYLVDLQRCQPAAAVHPPDQHCKESRSKVVNKQINRNVRIRRLQLRNFRLAFSSYQFFQNIL